MPSELKTPFPEALPLNLKTQIGQLIRTIDEYQKIAEANLNLSKEKMKKEYDKKAKDTVFDPSDLVWMFTPNVPIQMLRKLRSPWIGPFRVLERTSPLNYRLRSETTNKSLKMPVHVNRLRKYFTSGLRPEDDPDLRRKCRSDPDLGLRDNDVQAHNFINSPRENGKIVKHVINVENKSEHTVENAPNVESTVPGNSKLYAPSLSEGSVTLPPTLPLIAKCVPSIVTSSRTTDSTPSQNDIPIGSISQGYPNPALSPPTYGQVQLHKSRHPVLIARNDKSDGMVKSSVNPALPTPSMVAAAQPRASIDERQKDKNDKIVQNPISPMLGTQQPVPLPAERPFASITHGRSTPSGQVRYGVIYDDQIDKQVPTWISEPDLTTAEKQYLDDNPVKVLRSRPPVISLLKSLCDATPVIWV